MIEVEVVVEEPEESTDDTTENETEESETDESETEESETEESETEENETEETSNDTTEDENEDTTDEETEDTTEDETDKTAEIAEQVAVLQTDITVSYTIMQRYVNSDLHHHRIFDSFYANRLNFFYSVLSRRLNKSC